MRAQLLQAERAHFGRGPPSSTGKRGASEPEAQTQQPIEDAFHSEPATEALNAKRQRILEETRDEDADEDDSSAESSEDERWICASQLGDNMLT